MKQVVLLCVLAALCACASAAAVEPALVEESPVEIFEEEPADAAVALAPAPDNEPGAVFEFGADDDEQIGKSSARNRLLFSNTYRRSGVANTVQRQTITIRFNANIRISRVRVAEVGASQSAMAHVIDGGVNRNYVTIRFTSARGRGYNFSVQIHGR